MRQARASLSTALPCAPLLLALAVQAAYGQTSPPADDDANRQVITITTGTRNAKAVDKIAGAVTVIGKDEVAHSLAVTEDATAVLARSVPS